MAKKLRWSKAALGEWHGRLGNAGSTDHVLRPVVAVAVKTGTHLDHYPWDWYLTDYGMTRVPQTPAPCRLGAACTHPPKMHERRVVGVTDTLRVAKSEVEETLA